ncbi:type VII secretion system-associated protein [Streptomyces sp. BBFR51]|uniref:type VII secretion system-associated protein n=1 Tax=Streptomyces sp. BBFR51 TaxID=3372856 RepID=UPI0037DD1482
MGQLTQLDGKSLQTFIDTQLKDFVTQTEEIRRDGTDPVTHRPARAVKSLVNGEATAETLRQNQFLALGPMLGDEALTHGKTLLDAITESAKSVDAILENQERLFRDIDRGFRETIKIIGSTQSDNISEINAEKFLDIFDDVDHDMSGSQNSTQDI